MDSIIYEQPLNEHLRVCLRLELLFQQAQQFIAQDSILSARTGLLAILEIINIIERPDLKTKLIKALEQQATQLTLLEQAPEIDTKKLKELLNNLDRLIDNLHAAPGKLAQSLRENDFLNIIRLQLAKPGGPSGFSCPSFNLWLHQSPEQRNRDLAKWLKDLTQLQSIIFTLLQLTRERAQFQLKFAGQGFYQETLDLATTYQLIRVSLSFDRKVFPEISLGQHHLAIHFFTPNFEGRPLLASHDIQFKLACCA